MLRISEVNIRIHEKDSLKGFASCLIQDSIKLDSIGIRKKEDGSLYLTFPDYKTKKGVSFSYFKPVTQEAARALEEAILGKLQELNGGNNASGLDTRD